MGIKDLNQFLKDKCPECFVTDQDLNNLRHTRIAIDSNLLLYRLFASGYSIIIKNDIKDVEDLINFTLISESDEDSAKNCHFDKKNISKNSNYNKVLMYVKAKINSLLYGFIKYHISPIFVFDGIAFVEKNDIARKKRKESRDKIKFKVEQLQKQLKGIVDEGSLLDIDVNLINELKNLLSNSPPINPSYDFQIIRRYITKTYRKDCITAPNEAEKFCSYLNNINYCKSIYTTDTDSYTFGAKLVIKEFDFNNGLYSAVDCPIILKRLNISFETFVDICILLGCDFNARVKMFGPAAIYKQLKKIDVNKTDKFIIEKLASNNIKLDFDCLNKDRCREIFIDHQECETMFNIIKSEVCCDSSDDEYNIIERIPPHIKSLIKN